jgi:inner membrane protein
MALSKKNTITIAVALAMLPDLDVIGFALGVQYGDPWGHRGG